MHRTWGGSLRKLFQRERRAMRKGNITEERFETMKKLVHDDPVAMDIVERFQSAYSATVKRQKRLDIIVDDS